MSKIDKKIRELEEKIKELENLSTDNTLNIEEDLQSAKHELKKLKNETRKKKTAWDIVTTVRNPKRPTALDYIDLIFDDFLELHGDREFTDDKAMVCGLAIIGSQNFTIIAEQKGRTTKENIERNFGMPNPESYKKGIRFMKQAEKFNRPIITFIDTKGAYPGLEAEERGQGEAIARSMLTLANLKTPIIVFVIGEGSSGGALAIGVGDKIIMLENAIYSVLSPEGFASILWKDSSRTEEAAEVMKITAKDLYKFKVIDEIIKEPDGGAQANIKMVAESMKKSILKSIKELDKVSTQELIENRYKKFRAMGEYATIEEK